MNVVLLAEEGAYWLGEWVADSGVRNVLMPGYYHRILLTDKGLWGC